MNDDGDEWVDEIPPARNGNFERKYDWDALLAPYYLHPSKWRIFPTQSTKEAKLMASTLCGVRRRRREKWDVAVRTGVLYVRYIGPE